MLQIKTHVGPSSIHGMGLILAEPVKAGDVLWRYAPGQDFKVHRNDVPEVAVKHFKHYAYLHPDRPEWFVMCGDHAIFWNHPMIGKAANAVLSEEQIDGEWSIKAAFDMEAGEELLICPESDADYERKLGLTEADQSCSTPISLSRCMTSQRMH